MEEKMAKRYHVNNTATATVCGLPYTIAGDKHVTPYLFRQLDPMHRCRKCEKATPVASAPSAGAKP
jgi:hypothetical protein